MNGANFLVECLKKEGVDTIFGYPGGAVIPLFDALYKDEDFNIIRTVHEQGASHAADGYARRTGKPGVLILTSGPGVTNAVTGVATAYSDSIPMVIISGQVSSELLRKNSFQEVDAVGIMMPITKHSILVKDPDDIAEAISEAFFLASSVRTGPVIVDITKDAFLKKVENTSYKVRRQEKDQRHLKYKDEINKLIEALKTSKRPVIYAGGGVIRSGSSDLLTKFAKQINIPVMTSVMGQGAFDRNDNLSYGIVGMHGTKLTNNMVYNSDLVIGIGVRFSDRAIGNRYGFNKGGKIAHIDVDITEFSKNVDTDIKILGDFREIFKLLIEGTKGIYFSNEKRKLEAPEKRLNFQPKNIIDTLRNYFRKDTILSTDVGQHQMWAMMYWMSDRPNHVLTSGGLGTMGYGLGAAIGAKAACPNQASLLITGDGSFRMNHQEVLTAKTYDLPITIVVFNNNTLGMVRQWQALFNEKRYSHTDIDDSLNLEYLAKAYDVLYFGKIYKEDELIKALNSYDYMEKTAIIEVMVDIDLGAFPIVPAGKGINETIDNEESKF